MANRMARITVENGGDTTKLRTALKSVNSKIRSTQQQLKEAGRKYCGYRCYIEDRFGGES